MKRDWKRDLVRITSSVAEVIVHIQRPTVVGAFAVAARALDAGYETFYAQNAWAFFADGQWSEIVVDGIQATVFRIAKQNKCIERQEVALGVAEAWVGERGGVKFGFVQVTSECVELYLPDGVTQSSALAMFRELIWDTLGPSLRVIRTQHGNDIVSTVERETFPSRTSQELFIRLQKFWSRGHSRSVLLHGPPGSGKSCVMRRVGELAGGRMLRVRARDLNKIDSFPLILQMLRPSVVLIDDLDRVEQSMQGDVLTELEDIAAHTKLLMCSVNDITKLDYAALRVGRFDDIIEILSLDEEVVDRLIGDVPDDIRARLRPLPVVWIKEFARLRDVFGVNLAIEELTTLQQRSAALQTEYDKS